MLKAALTRALAAPLVTAIVALPLVVVTTIVATPEVASAGPPCPAGTHAEQTTWGPTGINWPRPGNNQSSGTSETYVDELTPDVDVTFSISDPNNNNADADNPYQAAYGGMFGWDNVNGVTTQVNGAYGAGYLTLGMNSIRTTDHVTFTFDYESPVLIPNFSIGDIDGVGYGNSPAEEPHESYQDRLTFAAERDGQNVPLTLTPLGGATPVVSGQTAQANYVPGVNGNLNPGDAAGTIEVTVMEPITRFSFRYSNGPDDAAADQAAGVPPAPLPADANSISNSHAVRVNFFTVCVGNVDLGDTVFFDLDGDGVRDPSDPPAPGVTVELRDPSGNVIETAVTDSNGNYLFENLPPYDWTVTVDQSTLPTGSVPTVDRDPAPDGTTDVTLSSSDVLDADFGFDPPGSTIGDTVWLDMNGNGIQDAGEPGLPGTTVNLVGAGPDNVFGTADDTTASTVTDAGGQYAFTGLPAGSFRVTVDTSTLPSGATDPTYDENGTGTPNTTDVTVGWGEVHPTADFGYRGTGSIGDRLWHDVDGDGIDDPGEPGLAGIDVQATWAGPDGTLGTPDDITLSTTTDSTGAYHFTNLPLGDFRVTVDTADLPSGMEQSADPDATLDARHDVTLTSQSPNVDTADFGFTGTGSVGDRVWFDVDGDGNQDAGEPGIPGVDVTVRWEGPDGTIGTADDVVRTTTTGTNGTWQVDDLPAGDYQVTLDGADLPAGLASPTYDLDGIVTPLLADLTLGAGEDRTDVDFGFDGQHVVGDLVWFDVNGDGVQDPGEPGIPNVDVDVVWAGIDGIFGTGDDVTTTTTTDSSGAWSVGGIPSGEVRATVDTSTLPSGLANPTHDLDGIATPHTTDATVAGADRLDLDFGYMGDGAIGDRVWFDVDADGVQDPGENGVGGVGVTVTWSGFDGVAGTPDDVVFPTVTDSTGAWNVVGLPAGDYVVEVDPATLPPGMDRPTYDADGHEATPFEVHTSLSDGETDNGIDFGVTGSGSVGDRVWLDLDHDGVQDPGEPGIAGVDLTVTWAGPDGSLATTDDNIEYPVTTDDSGEYSVGNLPQGTYRAAIDPTSLPDGLEATSDLDGGSDRTAEFSLAAGQDRTDVDFGEAGVGEIGDRVWLDLDGDGVQDAGEPGIPGVTVELVSAGPNGVLGDSDDIPLGSQVTDATGQYLFTGLPDGPFAVTVTDGLVGDLSQTGDPDSTLDDSTVVTLDSGAGTTSVRTADFGYQGPGAIGDRVWNDLDGDGVQDPGEPGLPGVTVTATADINGSPVAVTTVTDADGNYEFTGLPLGTWTVTLDPTSLPGGMSPSFDLDGTDTPRSATVTIDNATPERNDVDFGEVGSGSIGDRVWNDLDGDGVQDPGEPGLPGIDIEVSTTIGGEVVTYSTATGVDGIYTVDGLPLGDYTVVATDIPDDLTVTFDATGPADAQSTVTLTPDAPDATNQDFGLQGAGTIGDRVWLDVDGDGVQDTDEPPIPGVTVTATTTIDGHDVTVTTTTDADGVYQFTNLPFGDWTVALDPASLPPSTTPTFDRDGTDSPRTTEVTIDEMTPSVSDVDFGEQGPGMVGDTVWNDLDGDGVQDPGEPGLGMIPVEVHAAGADGVLGTPDDVVIDTVTDSDGNYEVSGLPTGPVSVTVAPGSEPAGTSPTYDSDGTDTPGMSVTVLTPEDPTDTDQDFGYAGPGALSGLLYHDVDGDGTQDPGEPGLAGVPVTVVWSGTDGVPGNGDDASYEVLTGPDGSWSLTGLPLGEYSVTIDSDDLPPGITTWTQDPDELDGMTTVVLDADNPVDDTSVFGVTGTGSIGDLVWLDLDGDGVADAGEPPLSNVDVTVTWAGVDGEFGTADDVDYPTQTGLDGSYLVDNLPAGEMRVTIDPASLPGTSPTHDRDATADRTTQITLDEGQDITDADFGEQGNGSITHTEWHDLDGDGTIDPGEPVLPGVSVDVVWAGPDGVNGTPDDVTIPGVTGEDGTVSFDGLPDGPYQVVVDTDTIPTGLSPSTPTVIGVTITPAEPDATTDSAVRGPGALTDTVWIDTDRDGVQDPGEHGVPDITVTVIGAGPDGELGTPDDVTYTTETDSDGVWLIEGLPEGPYQVSIDPDTVIDGGLVTADGNGPNDGVATVTIPTEGGTVRPTSSGFGIAPPESPAQPPAPTPPANSPPSVVGQLARTGADLALPVTVGLALIAAGFLLTRRKRANAA